MASDSEKKASVREDQLLAMRGIVAGSVFLLLVALVAVCGPMPRPHLPSLEDKLVFTLQWQAVSAFALIAGLVWVEATRALTTAINPLDKDAEKQNLSGVAPRYASNTLEQYLLSSGASLILSTHLSSENMHVIPVLVILFMFGRITFALGYKYYHAHRAFGHMITAFPTVCVYVYCVYRLVMNNFGYNRSRPV
ncbi:hypothetical protein ABFA07_004997 [Porites harrisoni]